MKGRSQRLQTANQPDDWVDDSWTVDCICGVNFDDGEEMVKCDECGVWVHTRCSRYVKEEELFTCDKCKNRNNRNDVEETEVAQFLVELPTKTVRIESNCVVSGPAKKPPVRIWTEMSMEEKVHVQGIPGGDPGLFSGLPTVFSQQLWKCSGYVPKKFNFQYEEFSGWNADKNDVANAEDDNDNTIDKGAGVLFSLSKERALASPVTAIMSTQSMGGDVTNDKKARPKEVKNSDMGDAEVRRSQNEAVKEKNLRRPVIVYSGKRKKEESSISKDVSGKKKARTNEKDLDGKRRSAHASKSVFTPTSDAKPLEFYEDRGAKSFKTDIRSVKNRNLKDSLAVEPISDCRIAVSKTDEILKHDVAASDHAPEVSSAELTGPSTDRQAKDKLPHSSAGFDTSADEVAAEDGCNISSEIKVVEIYADNSNGGSSDKPSDRLEKSRAGPIYEIKDNQIQLEMKTDKSAGSQRPEVKAEVGNDAAELSENLESLSGCLPDANSPKVSVNKSTDVVMEDISRNLKESDLVSSSLQFSDKKSMDVTQVDGEFCNGKKDGDLSADPRYRKEDAKGMLPESLSEPKQIPGDEELLKSGATVSSAAPSSRLRVAISLGKSSSTGSSIVISKSSSSNKSKPSDTRSVGYQVAADFREHGPADMRIDEEKPAVMQKTEENSLSQLSKIRNTSVPKGNASDSKNTAVSLSSRASTESVSAKTGSADSSHTLNQSTLHAQNRSMAPGLSSKLGKSSHTAFHPSAKGSHAAAAAANQSLVSHSTAALSDEELALLLHQELNSSPRVPRVPRIRQANLPHLASQVASTLHTKRTSSSGSKDQYMVPKRKSKDSTKDSATRPREVGDEARKTGRATSSSDQKRQDRLSCGDASMRDAKGSSANSSKKNACSVSTSANSGPTSSNEANEIKRYSRLASPLSYSDDDFSTDPPPVHRTLPGLISEIMSRGRRMTYEELCDAVLPHWPSLRKHNGERYAYSSHSQAVLDCLRNRQEWAQLVDRGPKTNSCRKRRREDSEDDEESKQRGSRDAESRSLESQREDVPKGKRKARRRRRLTLQGREIKHLRSKRRAGKLSDDEDEASSSNSSEEDAVFTEEDDIQEGTEASSGSEEVSGS